MYNRYARYAAAAIVIAAAGLAALSLTVLNNGVSRAYALDQTVQAMHSVRSLHMKFTQAEGGHVEEAWSEFDPAGQVVRCRMDFPRTEDGHKVVFWRDGKASVWFKTKGGFLTIADQEVARQTFAMACANDPKLMVSRLHEAEARGQVRIETQAPSAAGEPIVLVATHQPVGEDPARREVLHVDPVTKLVTRIENYRQAGEQFELLNRIDILDYNQPVDPAVFNPHLSEDVIRVDQTTQQIGLPQGDMTPEQVATQVVRQFFQALIDKDYPKAGQLYGGMPATKMQEIFGGMHVVRIVSIGEPTPHKVTGGLRVPITVEVERDGQLHEWSPYGPFVRQVESDRTRWQIIGGI